MFWLLVMLSLSAQAAEPAQLRVSRIHQYNYCSQNK